MSKFSITNRKPNILVNNNYNLVPSSKAIDFISNSKNNALHYFFYRRAIISCHMGIRKLSWELVVISLCINFFFSCMFFCPCLFAICERCWSIYLLMEYTGQPKWSTWSVIKQNKKQFEWLHFIGASRWNVRAPPRTWSW
jgi:hypothetical protein